MLGVGQGMDVQLLVKPPKLRLARLRAAAVTVLCGCILSIMASALRAAQAPIPVIFDTDIGTDIDDTWALALILASPELDLRLVVTDSGDTRTRARIAARFLERSGRGDVAIGIGLNGAEGLPIAQAEWAEGYALTDYPGPIHEDGVAALIDLVRAGPDPMTILAVGPVPNIAEALRRAPDIARRARVVAMSGSVNLGYVGRTNPDPEYNVRADVPAARAMYEAPWDLLIAPLDTAGQVRLHGDLYQRLLTAKSPMAAALLENYRIWAPRFRFARHDPDKESSILYDALAVALVFDEEFCEIEEIPLEVTDDGFTRRRPDSRLVRAAVHWNRERASFEEFLVDRLVTYD